MTPRPDYPYSGIFISELAAAGRASTTIRCERCDHSRTFALVDLMAEHGDIVMPDALNRVTAGCPKRHEVGVSYPRCSAVYADPVTDAEMARIRAARPPEPMQDARHRRRW